MSSRSEAGKKHLARLALIAAGGAAAVVSVAGPATADFASGRASVSDVHSAVASPALERSVAASSNARATVAGYLQTKIQPDVLQSEFVESFVQYSQVYGQDRFSEWNQSGGSVPTVKI